MGKLFFILFLSRYTVFKGDDIMLLETLPEVQLQDLDGNTYSTAQLKGKKALIFMWASW